MLAQEAADEIERLRKALDNIIGILMEVCHACSPDHRTAVL
jgi:hypothetical protein